MTVLGEPEDGSYVLVVPFDPPDAKPEVYRRQNHTAMASELGNRHWVSTTVPLRYPKSWQELTDLGEIAYVGKLVDHSRFPIAKGEPWASL